MRTRRAARPRLATALAVVAVAVPGAVSASSAASGAADPDLAVAAYSRSVPEPPRTTCPITSCVDARTFGADGTDGAPDGAALDAASSAAATARKVLWLPTGTYLLDRPWRPLTGVTIAGAGIDRTVLKLHWPSLAGFGHSYMLHATRPDGTKAADVTVRDLTVHGSRDESGCPDGTYTAACPQNRGGGIGAGDGWTVKQVRFTNLNYFKLGLFGVRNVKVLHNRFDDALETDSSGGEDNIGGGKGADNILIQGNRWADTAVGNAIDLTVATRVRTIGNESWKQSIIYEGVRDSEITGNVMHGAAAAINVKPNSHYDGSIATWGGIYQPRNVVVRGNRVSDVAGAGIVLFYFPSRTYETGPGTEPPTLVAGGRNVIEGNTVSRTTGVGIAVLACEGAVYDAPDILRGNLVVDVSWKRTDQGLPTYSTSGCGQFAEPTGIAVSGAAGTVLGTNTARDTRIGTPVTAANPTAAGPHTAHAVTVGTDNVHATSAPLPPRLGVVSRQVVSNLSTAIPVEWNVAVPTAVTPGRVDERGGTVLTITGYGLGTVDRLTAGGVTLGGAPATGLSAPSAPDATGTSRMTAVAPAGTGVAALVLRTRDGRSTGQSVPVRYGPAVDPVLPPSTVLRPGTAVLVSTVQPVGTTATAFSALRITASVDGQRAALAWIGPSTLRLTVPTVAPGPASLVLWRDGVAGRPDDSGAVPALVTRLGVAGGTVTGGQSITVSGAGFTGSTQWRFGDASADCTIASDRAAICTAPPGQIGTVSVRFEPTAGTPWVDTPAARFTYRAA